MGEETLDGDLFGREQPCFGCSKAHPFGLHLSFEREGDGVLTRFTPGKDHQGPPGIMHGGLVATLADEIGAWALIAALGKFGFTTQLDLRLKNAVRVGAEVLGRGRVAKAGSRVVETEVTISQHGQVCAECSLKFVLFDQKGAEKMLGRELPPEWQRFSR